VPLLHQLSHLPVVVDPSHATGMRDKVPPMALAAVAAGADAIMVEVHPTPERALSDGAQSLDVAAFEDLVARMRTVARAVGRDV
jgi:3-deoxy-7-phosphoheptulonate synthase